MVDSQLRSYAVESYLRLVGEPKLPSVLPQYGTADGKFSASYISGKLCDVAEAHSCDNTVKGYAITALMKIYVFEIAAGRKVEMLSECQSLIEELAALHSTDPPQRAYELQALVGLDPHAVECILPVDGSCEDIEIVSSDIMGSYNDVASVSFSQSSSSPANMDNFNFLAGSSNSVTKAGSSNKSAQPSKGSNPKDSLEKDALVRQMGVTPMSQNPELFKDLFR